VPHLPPVPTGPLILVFLALVIVRGIVAVAVRRVRRRVQRDLRKALVMGLAIGAGTGFTVGRRRMAVRR
jgi:hypothetical protein